MTLFPKSILAGLLLLGGPGLVMAQGAAPAVTLNGIAAIFDDRRAFFKLPDTDNFSISEGESKYGIELMTIDFSNSTVRIINNGQPQTLRLCAAPILTADDSTGIGAKGRMIGDVITIRHADGTFEFQPKPANAPGHAAQTLSGSGAAGAASSAGTGNTDASSSASNNNNTSANTSAANNGDGSGSSDPATGTSGQGSYHWWAQGAEAIEQARLATADQVRAGEWQPYPRTPLTPDNTAPELIRAANPPRPSDLPGASVPSNY